MRYVLGLNQYSHDAGACLLSLDGTRSLVIPNERLSRVKHDGGDTADAVRHALDAVGASVDDIAAVCTNNHHHRVLPFERRLPWSVALGLYPDASLSEFNLLPSMQKYELSHHLAHAWSVIAQAPFESGLVVVMDGMGETFSAMQQSMEAREPHYVHDLLLDPSPHAYDLVDPPSHAGAPMYREAETVYSFDGDDVRRVFKRWVPHRSPSELYNHGFENLESLGALYSRVSSHIFGDWNACGKVMGLGPWAGRWDAAGADQHGATIPSLLRSGQLEGVGDDALVFDWAAIEALPHPNRGGRLLRDLEYSALSGGAESSVDERCAYYASLASRVQSDLEEQALGFLKRLRERTGETNVCLVGGVVQNSVLNGRIAREAGFERVFIPAWPGDEGIAAGCAAFAHRQLLPQLGITPPARRPVPWSPYQGRAYSADDVEEAVAEFLPWLEEVDVSDGMGPTTSSAGGESGGVAAATDENGAGATPLDEGGAREDSIPRAVVDYAAHALADGMVIAWWQGRAEVGARALGHRSILANPTRGDMHRRANIIKRREQYRPLAPSVLEDQASEWFDGIPPDGSAFMSITASVREDVRERVPAITHIDGSARLQTVGAAAAPLYYALIAAFFALTGVPMVMNTSFNLAGMPIVESPSDALACFLDADPDLSLLVLQGRVFRRREFPSDPEEAAYAFPRQQRSFVSRSVADPTGEPLRVEVLVDEVWIELTDSLELEVLERCAQGEATVRQLAVELVAESEGMVEESDVVERVRHLYGLRLISL